MINLDGQSLDELEYLKFGQDKHVPIITASTRELANELLSYLSKE